MHYVDSNMYFRPLKCIFRRTMIRWKVKKVRYAATNLLVFLSVISIDDSIIMIRRGVKRVSSPFIITPPKQTDPCTALISISRKWFFFRENIEFVDFAINRNVIKATFFSTFLIF